MVGSDSKSMLNSFAQKRCQRPITKQDIVYTVTKYGDQFQATVTLNCIEGAQFAGEVSTGQKEAEQNAAQMALTNYGDEVAIVMAQPAKNAGGKKRKAADVGLSLGADGMGASPNVPGETSARSQLNTMLMRYLRQTPSKDDLVYSTVQTALGFQCTVTMPCLGGEWTGLGWAGEVADKKKQAEENAAMQALEALSADPEFMAGTEKAKGSKQAKKGGGKGWGKDGWGKDGWGGPPEMMEMMMAVMGKAKGKGFKGGMKGFKGKGKGFSGPRTRERISEAPLSGTITEWKGKFGFIQPMEPIPHESMRRNDGKVFLHIKDWPKDIGEPIEGASVSFQLYQDVGGVGAEEVLLV